jgi:hypothetical protein
MRFNDAFIIGDDEATAPLGTAPYDVRLSGGATRPLIMTDRDLDHLTDPYERPLAETMFAPPTLAGASAGAGADLATTGSLYTDAYQPPTVHMVGADYKPLPMGSAGVSLDAIVALGGSGVGEAGAAGEGVPATPTLGGRLQPPHGLNVVGSAGDGGLYEGSRVRTPDVRTDPRAFDRADTSAQKDFAQRAAYIRSLRASGAGASGVPKARRQLEMGDDLRRSERSTKGKSKKYDGYQR